MTCIFKKHHVLLLPISFQISPLSYGMLTWRWLLFDKGFFILQQFFTIKFTITII
jgi:hypothetical protein